MSSTPEQGRPTCLRPPWHPDCYWPKCKCGDARLASEDARDWHEYECAHGHRWWSAPTSTRCPVCNTSTYTPGAVTFAALPSTSGPSEDALCDETENCPSEDWHYWRCPKYDGKALPSPSGPDAETLAAQILRELENANSYEAGEGVDVDACKVLLSGLVALVEQRERERDEAQRVLEIAAKKAHEEFDRRVAAEALLARYRQALERYGRHDENCARYRHDFKVRFQNMEPTCLCGYTAALAASAPGTEEEPAVAHAFSVYAITFDQETFGIFATRKAAEESLAQQIAEGGPAWSDCNVEQWRVRGTPEIGAGGTENT